MTMRTTALFLSTFLSTAVALCGLVGCDPDTRDADAAITVPDAGDTDAGSSACAGDPGEPYGTSEGSHLVPFTLSQCDGTPYSFYGEAEGFCDATFTVIVMSAGWCGPCRVEATQMQARLVEAYADQGVRVITSIIQNDDYEAPDLAFCQGWTDQYGLTNAVVIDPTQETSIYFPAGSLPATVIVDSEGVIRHREYGTTTGLATIRAALDALLAP